MKKNKKHKWKYQINIKKKAIVSIILGVSLFVGLGYAILESNLEIFGTLEVGKYDKTLYAALKREVNRGYALKYAGAHQDSMDPTKSTEDIYHFYADSEIKGTEILNKNNVIFANHCWQMIRTTDTGGVRMIYNGEAENNQCLNTRGAHVGYNNGESQDLTSSYWYGTDYTYDAANNVFRISGTTEQATWNATTGPGLVGKYTCKKTAVNSTCSILYFVESYESASNGFVIQLNNSSDYSQFGTLQFNYNSGSLANVGYMYNTRYTFARRLLTKSESISNSNDTYTYGDNFIDNEDGTYTIDNPQTINGADWNTDYSDVGANKYVCKNATNDTCSDLWYTVSTSNTTMIYIVVSNNFKYAKSFDYRLDPEDNTYKYFLDDSTMVSFWDVSDSNNKTSLNNAHYTCFDTSGKCTTISYIYFLNTMNPEGSVFIWYTNLMNGKSVEDALNEMLTDDNVNTINSIIKSGVEAWYKKYLYGDYDSYIDDTIYCNDRSIRALNGWDPDGGSLGDSLQFKEYKAGTDLSCTNITDRFSVSNPSAPLTYKVGLMTVPEMNLLNQSSARKTGQSYWLNSPNYMNLDAGVIGRYVYFGDGGISSNGMGSRYGVRPAVSLVSGVEYSRGDGSMAKPYIVDIGN